MISAKNMLSFCDPAECTFCPYFDEEWEKCYGDGHQRELELKSMIARALLVLAVNIVIFANTIDKNG